MLYFTSLGLTVNWFCVKLLNINVIYFYCVRIVLIFIYFDFDLHI